MKIATRNRLLGAASMMVMIPTAGHAQDAPGQPAQPASTTQSQASQDGSADQTAAQPQEIVVTGIRGSQRKAVNIKRDAASVVDSIAAEDIGKLPDVTISDSLQRIPGVQILRSAGEGASVNIRGLPQVSTLINGEAFLGANSITSIQPNFNDIPSQLFAGADVIKSTTADELNAGITGTINLRTRRPFDLKQGLTVAAAAEGAYGDKTKHEFDPNVNGLLSWHNDRFGVLVAAAYSNVRLYNSQSGILRDFGATYHDEGLQDAKSSGGFSPPNRPRGTPVDGGVDVNGDGDANDVFIVPQGFGASRKINQRKRLGLNGSFQFRATDAVTLTGDAFFTKQKDYGRLAGFQQANINWQAAEFQPGQSRNTGTTIDRVINDDGAIAPFDLNTVQQYNYDLGGFDSYSEIARYDSQSQNYNLELDWDNGGPFKAKLRGVYSKAHQDYDLNYLQFSLSNGLQWQPGGVGHYPGGDRVFNANGYTVDTIAGLDSLPLTVDYSGSKPVFALPGQLTDLLGNIDDYALKTTASENNYRRKADQKVIRLDASYEASPDIMFEFGGRYSDRSASNYQFDRAAPLYAGQGASDPNGCLVKWKAFDVSMNDASCSAGDAAGFYTAGLTRKASDPSFNGQVRQFDIGVAGIPGLYVLDPAAMDDVQAFQDGLYPGNVEIINPGSSYRVGVEQISGYAQMTFSGDLGPFPFSGNAGVKVINTRLDITQGVTGSPQPYGLPNLPNGTVETNRNFTDILPAFNIAFDVATDVKFRVAYSKTMTLLDLNQWGGGLTTYYSIDTSGPTPIFRVTSGSQAGNPQLDPWRATNVEGSLEWYIGQASLLSIGAFYIDVESFIQAGNIIRTDLPDNDGVIRGRPVSISTPIQGQGGALKGIETGAKLSFSDIDFFGTGFLSNFGVDGNFTYSPSDSGQTDLAGNTIPFQDNSEYQYNAAIYYQDSRLQARVAWNHRSKRAAQSDFGGVAGLELYQSPTSYIDASISYDVTPAVTVYAQGSNLTGEYEKYYLTWKDERAYNNIFERRFTLGARLKF